MKIISGFVLPFLLFLGNDVEADFNIMPKVLVEYGINHQCSQIDDYYDDPEELWEPPFAFIEMPQSGGMYAAFWCKGNESVSDNRILIYEEVESSNKINCPREIRWNAHPRGISIIYSSEQDLKKFKYIHKNKPSKNTTANGILIKSMHDGTGVEFFCSGSDGWLYRMLD